MSNYRFDSQAHKTQKAQKSYDSSTEKAFKDLIKAAVTLAATIFALCFAFA
jgi:hypothetical protein